MCSTLVVVASGWIEFHPNLSLWKSGRPLLVRGQAQANSIEAFRNPVELPALGPREITAFLKACFLDDLEAFRARK